METRGLNARAHVRVDSKSEEFVALADYREKVYTLLGWTSMS